MTQATSPVASEPLTSRRTKIAIAVLAGSSFLTGVDLFIVNVAFDKIGVDFGGPSLSSLSWVLNSYAVVFAALLIPMGRLADRYGHKSSFVAGLTVFTLASLACGLSTNVWELVAWRAIQAIGAAAMTPTALGLLVSIVPQERRASTVRTFALTGAVAAAFGPALGGLLVQISWQWAFWINVPLGVVLVWAAIRSVPDVRHNEGAPQPDLLGGLIITVASGALVLGITQGSDWGWTSDRVLVSFVVAIVLTALLVRRMFRHHAPIIDPSLFSIPSFTWANIASFVYNVAFGIALLSRILWIEDIWHYGPIRTGFAVALGPLLVPITSVIVHRVWPRAHPGILIAIGSVLFGLASILNIELVTVEPAYWRTMFLPWVVGGIGVGFAMPNLVSTATNELPKDQSSTGSGVSAMARQIGMTVGIAILVAVLANGVPQPSHFRAAWWIIAGVSFLAALLSLNLLRRTESPHPATA